MQDSEKDRIKKIRKAILLWFRNHDITRWEAAKMLGVRRESFNNRLSNGFSERSANAWVNAFGFNRHFLITGEGSLVDEAEAAADDKDAAAGGPTLDDMLLTLAKTQGAALTAALAELERYRALYGPLPEADEDRDDK